MTSKKPYPSTFAETMNMIQEHYCYNPSRLILEPRPETESKMKYAVRCRKAECLASLSSISLAYHYAELHLMKEKIAKIEDDIHRDHERIKKNGPLRTQVELICRREGCNYLITEANPRLTEDTIEGCMECHADNWSNERELEREREAWEAHAQEDDEEYQEEEEECPGCDYCDPDMTPEDIERHHEDEDEEPVTVGEAFASVGIK